MTEKIKTVGITGNGTSFRDITVVPPKFKGISVFINEHGEFNSFTDTLIARESMSLSLMAGRTIHNLVKLVVQSYDFTKKELHFSLYTKNSSYDLNRFYQELSNNGYILR
jgi:hypothetical protein